MAEETTFKDPELQVLSTNKLSGYKYQERRHDDWRENYTLYRNKVIVNRLTQRQTVNIPLMKQTVRTILKDIDDMPVLYFENLSNDKQAEMFKNQYWNWTVEQNQMELQDIVDKRQVIIFGRSFDQWQIADGMVKMTVQDPQDILIDRYCDPTNIDSARFLIHTHIYIPLSKLIDDPMYDQKKVRELVKWYGTEAGLIKQEDNQKSSVAKAEKMADMGLEDAYDPIIGETTVELSMHFVMRKEPGDEHEQFWLYVEAEDREILSKRRLEDVIGKTKDHFWRDHLPYSTWADDVERQDFWSDSIGDTVRQPNKVLNAWFSQLVENRTLRNFGMHYYDNTVEGFVPGSFEPKPWGWYGIPGKPKDVLQKVDIPDLSESLDEIQFVINTIEKATGATATQQGAQTERQITLGEVELALGEAKERVRGLSKFYTPAWKRRGLLFVKLIEAGADKLDAVKIYKKGRNSSDIYSREIGPKDWMSKEGYGCKVWSQEEKNNRDTESLQKINAAMSNMPGNMKLIEVYQRKLLEFADLTPEEINEIMELEKERLNPTAVDGAMGQVVPSATPAFNQVPQAPQQPAPAAPVRPSDA